MTFRGGSARRSRSFAVIDQQYEKILKGPTYSPAVQCGIYAMTAGAFAIFFGGNLWDGFASLFVGALIRVTLYALSAIKLRQSSPIPLGMLVELKKKKYM